MCLPCVAGNNAQSHVLQDFNPDNQITDMNNDTTFNVIPSNADELDAAEILFNDPRAEEFFDSLRQDVQGNWVVTFKRGETNYTLRNFSMRTLALEFLHFDPARERRREEQA